MHVALERQEEVEYGVSGADVVCFRRCNEQLLLVLNAGRDDASFAVRVCGKKRKRPVIGESRGRRRPGHADDNDVTAAVPCPCLIGFATLPDAESSPFAPVSRRKAAVVDPGNVVYEEISHRLASSAVEDPGSMKADAATERNDGRRLRLSVSPTRVDAPDDACELKTLADEGGNIEVRPLSSTFVTTPRFVPRCFSPEAPLWAMEPDEFEGLLLCEARIGEERRQVECFADELEDLDLLGAPSVSFQRMCVLQTTPLEQPKLHVRKGATEDICAFGVTKRHDALSLELVDVAGGTSVFNARIATRADGPNDYKLAILFDYLPAECVFLNETSSADEAGDGRLL